MAHTPKPGEFCWNELMTNNIDSCKTFYTQLLGWTTEEKDMGPAGRYVIFKKGETQVGGMMKMEGPQFAGVPPHWSSYVLVENVDESTRQATKLGGKQLMPPSDIPNIGRFSVVNDPAGATICLFESTPSK